MRDVIQNQPDTITVQFVNSSNGSPLTGVTASDVSMNIRKDGGSVTVKTLDPSNFREIDATAMPGLYDVDFTATDFDTVGEFIAVIPPGTSINGNFDQIITRAFVVEGNLSSVLSEVALVRGSVNEIRGSTFDTTTDSLDLLRDTVDSEFATVKGTGFATSTDSLQQLRDVLNNQMASLGVIDSNVDTLVTNVSRLLGLSQENVRITGQAYDSNNNLTSSTIRIYPTRTDVQNQTNSIAEYQLTASYDANNRLIDYRIEKVV